MRIILTATILSLLLLCSCASTCPKQTSCAPACAPAQSKPESVTAGGEIQMRGQYLKGN